MHYIQAKLVTGETIIGVLASDTNAQYEIVCPMLIKYHSILLPAGKVVEHLTASPYMRLSDNLYLLVDHSHVIGITSLNKQGITIYVNLLDEHHDEYELKHAGIYSFVEDRFKEIVAAKHKTDTLDDVNTSLDFLKALIDKHRHDNEEEMSEDIPKGSKFH